MYVQKYCKYCNTPLGMFDDPRKKYCSEVCIRKFSAFKQQTAKERGIRFADVNEEELMELLEAKRTKTCLYCGMLIDTRTHGKRQYCSDRCKRLAATIRKHGAPIDVNATLAEMKRKKDES